MIEEMVCAEIVKFLCIGEETVRPGEKKNPYFLVAYVYEAAWCRGEHEPSGTR